MEINLNTNQKQIDISKTDQSRLLGFHFVQIKHEPVELCKILKFENLVLSGGEAKHISSFSDKGLTSIAVSGLRNSMDLLNELELGRLGGVDFIECRACDLGCIGGTGTYESRFLSQLRLENIETEWLPSHEEMEEIRSWYDKGIWRLDNPIQVKERLPLSQDLGEAMAKLREMDAIFAKLPHIDCGSCGRPSCRAMAADLAKGEGEITDCIFKLKERITTLSTQIFHLCAKNPETPTSLNGQYTLTENSPEDKF